ncbi:hypothetical protein D9757_011175 [Collybiopsis confluens]|uniref:Uncharacterized protein n=1 Tax=Collybiopsis confluens TaxID=2823264 RepID=A0A8H5H2X9_9AGAR|nr:hypothetical protein D9757_011175 [Collybiopsis confluens]
MPPYTLPDPLEHSRTPSHDDVFPYGKRNKTSSVPAVMPAGYSVPFTDDNYEVPVISNSRILDNVHHEQRTLINDNADDFIAILPFGGGQGWSDAYPNAAGAIRAFIDGIDLEDKGSWDLVPARPARARKDFWAAPWALFLTGCSTDLRNFLLYQAVFPLHEPGASFFALPLSDDPNWFWLKLTGDGVSEGKEVKKLEAMAALKRKIWSNKDVLKVVRAYQAKEPQSELAMKATSPQHAVVDLTKSFRIIYNPPDTHRGNNEHRYIILGRPMSQDKSEQAGVKSAVQGIKPFVSRSGRFFNVNKDTSGCIWCKSDLHVSQDCPYPDVGEGWCGPTREDLERLAQKARAWKGPRAEEGPQGEVRGTPEHPRGRGGRSPNRGRARGYPDQ